MLMLEYAPYGIPAHGFSITVKSGYGVTAGIFSNAFLTLLQEGSRKAPGRLQKAPGMLQEGSRKAPRRLQEGSRKAPGKLQEGSRKVPGRLQEGSRKASGRFQEGSGRRQESSRYYTSHIPKHAHAKKVCQTKVSLLAKRVPRSPRKSQKEIQEDKNTLQQQGEYPPALLCVPGCPALPSGYFLGSLELPPTSLKVARN
jgi:hypothetical protein